MQYEFTIDSTVRQNPTNWRDIRIKYERDKITRSLFIRRTTELFFVGDAYDYLKTKFDSDPCWESVCEIATRCTSFDSFLLWFSGTIKVKDLVFDHGACIAKGVVYENSYNELFYNHKSVPVAFSDIAVQPPLLTLCDNDVVGPYTVLGNPTTDFTTLKDWLPAVTSSPAVAPDWFEPISGTGMTVINPLYQGAAAKYVVDLFEIIVHAITDNGVDFVSTHLTTRRQDQGIRITIDTNGMIAGDIVTIQTQDQWGQSYLYEIEYDGNIINLDTELTKILLLLPFPTSSEQYYFRGYPATMSNVIAGTVLTSDIYYHFPITVISLSLSGGGSIDSVEIQPYVRGLKQLFLCTGASLDYRNHPELFDWSAFPVVTGTVETLSLSFDELFHWLDNLENIGFVIEYNTGAARWELRIEPIDYFYDNTSALTLRSIKNATIQFDLEQINGAAAFGNKAEISTPYVYSIGLGSAPGIVESKMPTELIKADSLNCKSFWNFVNEADKYSGFGGKIAAIISGQQTYDDDLFLIEDDGDPTNTIPTAMAFRQQFFNQLTLVFGTFYFYNCSFQPLNSLLNRMINLPDMFFDGFDFHNYFDGANYNADSVAAGIVLPDGIAWKPKLMKFDKFITLDEFNSINPNGLITVNETDDPVNDVDGFISVVEYNMSTGFAHFEVLIPM